MFLFEVKKLLEKTYIASVENLTESRTVVNLRLQLDG